MKKITEKEYKKALKACDDMQEATGLIPAKEFDITLQYAAQQEGFDSWADFQKHKMENWEPFCASSLRVKFGENNEDTNSK